MTRVEALAKMCGKLAKDYFCPKKKCYMLDKLTGLDVTEEEAEKERLECQKYVEE